MIATKGQLVRLTTEGVKSIGETAIVKEFPYRGQPLGSRMVELDRQICGGYFWFEQDLESATEEGTP